MEYIQIHAISVKPFITPSEKRNELYFELVFYCQDITTKVIEPKFHTFLPKKYLEQLGKHWLDCVKKSKDIKTDIFTEDHYTRFGVPKKIEGEERRYIG